MLALLFHNKQRIKGILWVVAWVLSFSATMAMIKIIGQSVSTPIKIFMRLLFGFIFFSPIFYKIGFKKLQSQYVPLHLLRTFLILGSMFCTYYAYAHLPMAFVTSLGFTTPLMTTVLAIFFLHEQVRANRWIAIILGYLGILIVVRPGFIEFDFAIVVALLENLFASLALIILKKLTRTDSSNQIMFYTNTISVIITFIVVCFYWQTPSAHEFLLLSVLGAVGVLSQYCRIQSYRYEQPSFLAPFEYLRLVVAIPIGMFVFDECPDLWTIGGSVLIIFATLYMTMTEHRQTSSTLNS